MTFHELNLINPLLRAVEEIGYTTPSPIQAKAIPPVLQGRDLLGCAQTGTGKTAAFALPILQNLMARRPARSCIRALILTPTRELALQIGESFAAYGKYLTLRHTVIFGGVGQQPQVDALKKGVEVLIACPGRLNDLIGQGLIDLSGVEVFVLDEADRMLDMGFVHDVKKVIAKLPKKRQNLLFSATMPKEIEELAGSILHDPATVKVDPVSSTVDRIDQRLYYVEKKQKIALLAWLLKDPDIQNALVFSRTKHGADRIARLLGKAGITAAAIHGNKSQSARVAALEGFKAGKTRVLVATDIAARGIDINELSHVFNYDLPEVPETYVHRIGRTARAGADGVAISFCAAEEREYLAGIEKLNRKKIPLVAEHPFMDGVPALPTPEPEKKRAPKANAKPKPETPAPMNVRKEETTVENAENRPQNQETKGLSASAKRRRRRRRAQDRNNQAAAQQNQQTPQAQPEKAEKKADRKPEKAEKKPERKAEQPQHRDRQPERKQVQAERKQAQPEKKQNRQNAPARPAQPEKKQPQQAPRREAESIRPAKEEAPRRAEKKAVQPSRDDDPGLILISRKPPVQKFANFEAYMAAHGGETAPIVGEDE